MKYLESEADFVVDNHSLQLSKTIVADLIIESYDVFLRERGVIK